MSTLKRQCKGQAILSSELGIQNNTSQDLARKKGLITSDVLDELKTLTPSSISERGEPDPMD